MVDSNGNLIYSTRKAKLNRVGWLKGELLSDPGMFWRKNLFVKYGYFIETFVIYADYEFALRVLYKNKEKNNSIGRAVVNFERGGISNIGGISDVVRHFKERHKAWAYNNLNGQYSVPIVWLCLEGCRKLPSKTKSVLKKHIIHLCRGNTSE